MFFDIATSATLVILSKLSSIEQLVFFFVKASEAAVKTAISSTPTLT